MNKTISIREFAEQIKKDRKNIPQIISKISRERVLPVCEQCNSKEPKYIRRTVPPIILCNNCYNKEVFSCNYFYSKLDSSQKNAYKFYPQWFKDAINGN